MTEYLVIRLSTDKNAQATWMVAGSDGTRRGVPKAGPLEDAAHEAGDRPVIVLVPAAHTSTLSVDLPARGARLRAALPFAMEDHVAGEIEDLHFAAGERFASGRLPVVVVAHARMQDWLERLQESGISPARLVPENHGLPYVPNTLSMLASEGQLMFNDGSELEFVMQEVRPVDALTAAGVLDTDEPEGAALPRHLLVYCGSEDQQLFESDWTALRQELDGVDINLLADGVLPRLAVTVASGAGIDLLQGRYGEKTDVGAVLRPWRYAAALLLVLGIVGLAGKGVDYFRLAAEESALKEQFAVEYRKIRPNDTGEVLDPMGTVVSIRRALGGAASADPVFLPSLQQLALAIRDNEAAAIQAISYRAGVVDVRLTAPDVATLDRIRQSVSESARFTASIQSTDRIGDRVNSRIQIREAGS
jgi:general secretion pathway protein L